MTQYQERYKRQKEYHRLANLRAESADRRKRRGNSLSPRRPNYSHGYTSGDEGDGNITPENPDILSSEERRRLLEKRIKQLEENERKILELQLKERSSQQHSRYSERSHATSGNRVDPEGPKYYFTERYSRTDNPDTFRTDLYDSFANQEKVLFEHEETDEKMKEHAAINKISREYRANILNKAEKMIEDRKRREDEPLNRTNVSRVQEYVNEQQQMHFKQKANKERQNKTFVTKRPRSPPSDSEYIEVPEFVETDTDVSLGYRIRRKGRSQWSNRDIPSAIQSEIPILYSDEEDAVYPEPRPLTDTGKHRFDYHRRYVGDQDNYRINYRDPAHRKIGHSTGALVKFFCNGESNDKGVPLTINKSFRNFEQLLIYLSDKIPTPTGVRHIYKWPEGQEIKSLTEFRNRCVYIVASTNKLQKIKYGESQEKFWSNKKPSAGKVRRDELGLFQKPSSPKESPQKDSPRIVTVINNRNRDKKEKVILNPRTQQAFEDWLQDLNTPDMPVRALYTAKPPHVQVCSFSHLFRELKNQNNFIACGEEYIPLEISKKRQAPSSNSSTDSISESRSRKKKLPRQQEMGQIHENFENGRPMSTALSRYDYGPRFNPFPGRGPGRLIDSRRKDTVEIEVDGIIREFIPPSYFDPEDDGAKPDRILTPEWVYGFRGRDARQNILVLHETEEIVYYVAAVVVLYNKERDTQRHYIKHNEEITSMALHPDNVQIATGQLQGREPDHGAHIRIWNGVSLSDIAVIGLGVFSGGILSIGFSYDDDGTYLCALDMSEKHVLSVWDWRSEKVIARTSTTTDPVHYSCFYPDGSNTSILITFGIKHIYFWKIFFDAVRKKEAKILRDRNSGIFRVRLRDEIPESVNCITWLGSGDIVTGDTNGNLMLWERDSTDAFNCKMVIDAHSMSIMSLCLLEDGTLLSGAGTEIKAWDTGANFSLVKTRQIPDSAGHIRSIVTQREGGSDGRLYIGTTNSAVLDGSLQLKFKYLVQGHGQGVYGVVPHHFEPTFISAGEDQVVFKWSLVTHKLIWRSQIEYPSTCVAVDHRRELVAIGTGKGVLIFLNGYNGIHIATIEVGSEAIGCLSFSRDCHLLAMGCNDGSITVFEMSDRNPIFKSSHVTHSCHKTGVAHLDWSTDSRCLQSTDYNHELIFWNVDTMQQIEITRLVRDVDWHTATCDMAYYMIGPWSNLERGEYIKACSRSNARDLILTGDTKGRLRLYKYPCSKEKADFRSVRVYSSGVTAIAFTPDNRSALTCGGNDAALIQWSLVDDVQFLSHI